MITDLVMLKYFGWISKMPIFMLDTNAINSIGYDKTLFDCVVLAVNNRKLTLCITHIQEDEIEKIPNSGLRSNLLNFMQNYCTRIPTRGFVLGVSRLGEASFYDGEEIDAIYKGNIKMMHDALIAATAKCDVDYLVTDDNILRKRVKKEVPNLRLLTNS
ncbi:MAG: hypothetical protein WC391_01945 [Methanoregula sp.]|jgi:rRNA-processing protein FCF1